MAARFPGIVDHHTYVLASDGDLMEGVSQEAIGIAGHLKLNKLIVFWDDNGITIDGQIRSSPTTSIRSPASSRRAGIRCHIDGHDPKAILDAIHAAQNSDKPTMIACKTTIGFGLPTHAGTQKAHSDAPGGERGRRRAQDPELALRAVRHPRRHSRRLAHGGIARLQQKREAWNQAVEALDAKQRAEFERRVRGDLPEDLG